MRTIWFRFALTICAWATMAAAQPSVGEPVGEASGLALQMTAGVAASLEDDAADVGEGRRALALESGAADATREAMLDAILDEIEALEVEQ